MRCGIEGAAKSSIGYAGSAAEVGQSQSAVQQIYISLRVTSPYTFTPKVVCRQDYSTPVYSSKKRGRSRPRSARSTSAAISRRSPKGGEVGLWPDRLVAAGGRARSLA